MQFGTNVLGMIQTGCPVNIALPIESVGHFYLTKLLLPVLTATAKKNPAGTVRVVNLASVTHNYGVSEGIKWSTVGPGDEALATGRKLGATTLYNQSKLVRSTNSRYPPDAHFFLAGKYHFFE